MVMINDILFEVKNRLESAVQAAHARDAPWIRLTNLVERDGSVVPGTDDCIVMTVASIQSDPSLNAFKSPRPAGDTYAVTSPPLFLDVYVAFVSTFTGANYPSGLAILSHVAEHFQEGPVFETLQMEKLAIEFATLGFEQAAHLAAINGITALPYLTYRLRRLPFEGAKADIAPRTIPAPFAN